MNTKVSSATDTLSLLGVSSGSIQVVKLEGDTFSWVLPQSLIEAEYTEAKTNLPVYKISKKKASVFVQLTSAAGKEYLVKAKSLTSFKVRISELPDLDDPQKPRPLEKHKVSYEGEALVVPDLEKVEEKLGLKN